MQQIKCKNEFIRFFITFSCVNALAAPSLIFPPTLRFPLLLFFDNGDITVPLFSSVLETHRFLKESKQKENEQLKCLP